MTPAPRCMMHIADLIMKDYPLRKDIACCRHGHCEMLRYYDKMLNKYMGQER